MEWFRQKKVYITSLCMLLGIFVMTGMFFTGVTTRTFAADKEKDKWSWQNITEAAATVMNTMLAPKGNSAGYFQYADRDVGTMSTGNAGTFVGYTDEDSAASESHSGKFLTKQFTQGSVTYDYGSFWWTGGSGAGHDLYTYGKYGYVLNELGLDATGTSRGPISHYIYGGPFLFAYQFADTAPWAMNMFLKMMQTINPFAFLSKSAKLRAVGADFSTSATGGFEGAVNKIAAIYSDFYDTVYDLAWVMIPIFMVVLIAMLLLSAARKRSDSKNGGRIKTFLIRLVFLVIGIPMLGSMYTAALDHFITMTSASNSVSAKIVASSFVDFGAWAESSNLAVPDLAVIALNDPMAKVYKSGGSASKDDLADVAPSDDSLWTLRYTAAAINTTYGPFSNPFKIRPVTAGLNHTGQLASWSVEDIRGDLSTQLQHADGKIHSTGQNSGTVSSNATTVSTNLIARYIRGNFYNSSDFASLRMSGLNGRTKYGMRSKDDAAGRNEDWEMDSMSKKLVNEEEWENGKAIYNAFKDTGVRWAANNGSLIAWQSGAHDDDTSNNYRIKWNMNRNAGWGTNTEDGKPRGISDYGMYNYLNSEFTDSSVIVYSSKKAVSSFTRGNHYEVNLIGSGWYRFWYWFESICTLIAYGVIGWCYAILMLFANIKRGIMLMFKIPFAMMGVIHSIAQVITYTAVLILEIFGTLFVYILIMEFMQVVPNVISALFSNASAAWGIPIYSFLSGSFLILFVVYALKLRKNIIKGLDEGAAEIVDKFLMTQNSLGTPSGAMAGAKQGLAIAGGAMLGSKLMGSGDPASAKDDTQEAGMESNNAEGDENSEQNNTDNKTIEGSDTKQLSSGGGSEIATYEGDAATNDESKALGEQVQEAESLDSLSTAKKDLAVMKAKRDLMPEQTDSQKKSKAAMNKLVDAQESNIKSIQASQDGDVDSAASHYQDAQDRMIEAAEAAQGADTEDTDYIADDARKVAVSGTAARKAGRNAVARKNLAKESSDTGTNKAVANEESLSGNTSGANTEGKKTVGSSKVSRKQKAKNVAKTLAKGAAIGAAGSIIEKKFGAEVGGAFKQGVSMGAYSSIMQNGKSVQTGGQQGGTTHVQETQVVDAVSTNNNQGEVVVDTQTIVRDKGQSGGSPVVRRRNQRVIREERKGLPQSGTVVEKHDSSVVLNDERRIKYTDGLGSKTRVSHKKTVINEQNPTVQVSKDSAIGPKKRELDTKKPSDKGDLLT